MYQYQCHDLCGRCHPQLLDILELFLYLFHEVGSLSETPQWGFERRTMGQAGEYTKHYAFDPNYYATMPVFNEDFRYIQGAHKILVQSQTIIF